VRCLVARGPILSPMNPLRWLVREARSAVAPASNQPAYAAGLRAAIATVAPLVFAEAWMPGAGTWMSLAGFNGSLNDRGGPYRVRAQTMAWLAAAEALVVVLATLVEGHRPLAIALTLLVAGACSLGRVFGNAGAGVGTATLCTFLIALGVPAAGLHPALWRAGFILAGGAWAMLVALVLWPLRPDAPVRAAVALSYRALADYASDVGRHAGQRAAQDVWELRRYSMAVRTALEEARAVLAATRRGRPGESTRGERLVVLHEIGDQLFAHQIAINDTLDALPRDATPVDTLEACATSLRAIADAVEADHEVPFIPVTWDGAIVRHAAPTEDAATQALRAQAGTLLDRAAQYAAAAAATARSIQTGRPVPSIDTFGSEPLEAPLPFLSQLRALAASDSMVLRHALRVAITTAAAVWLAGALGLARDYWVTITVVVLLQPYTGMTTQRALQRLAGTLVGGALTALLGAWFHDPRAILVLAFVFSATCVALLPVNYAAFSVFVTPAFVLLAEARAGDWHLARVRIVNTLLGGALALLGARVLWPGSERTRLPTYMAAALRACRDALVLACDLVAHPRRDAVTALGTARRHIALAAANAEESFQRLLGEHDGAPQDLEPVMTFLAYLRRLSASLSGLVLSSSPADAPPPEALRAFGESAAQVLEDLADAVTQHRSPVPLPSLTAPAVAASLQLRIERLQRQIKSLHDAVHHWTKTPAAAGRLQ
jgi:uncharacterized membrane protein YccC